MEGAVKHPQHVVGVIGGVLADPKSAEAVHRQIVGIGNVVHVALVWRRGVVVRAADNQRSNIHDVVVGVKIARIDNAALVLFNLNVTFAVRHAFANRAHRPIDPLIDGVHGHPFHFVELCRSANGTRKGAALKERRHRIGQGDDGIFIHLGAHGQRHERQRGNRSHAENACGHSGPFVHLELSFGIPTFHLLRDHLAAPSLSGIDVNCV